MAWTFQNVFNHFVFAFLLSLVESPKKSFAAIFYQSYLLYLFHFSLLSLVLFQFDGRIVCSSAAFLGLPQQSCDKFLRFLAPCFLSGLPIDKSRLTSKRRASQKLREISFVIFDRSLSQD
jgi:hypothetical protein